MLVRSLHYKVTPRPTPTACTTTLPILSSSEGSYFAQPTCKTWRIYMNDLNFSAWKIWLSSPIYLFNHILISVHTYGYWFYTFGYSPTLCCCSATQSWLTLCDPGGLQHTRPPCPSPSPGVSLFTLLFKLFRLFFFLLALVSPWHTLIIMSFVSTSLLSVTVRCSKLI